ncbi:hypothetical protein [Acidovorax lacteus]
MPAPKAPQTTSRTPRLERWLWRLLAAVIAAFGFVLLTQPVSAAL